MKQIVIRGAAAGVIAALTRLCVSWVTHVLGLQPMTVSHVYGLLFLGTQDAGGLLVGSIGFVLAAPVYGVLLAYLLEFDGYRHWWLKGAGLGAVAWPYTYVLSRRLYTGPQLSPTAIAPLSSLAGFVLAGFIASWYLWLAHRYRTKS
ncbi:MAG: hypothetical protein AB1576_05605 [Bacillota bacterium]